MMTRSVPLMALMLAPCAGALAEGAPPIRAHDAEGASVVEIPLAADGFSVEKSGARQVDIVLESDMPGFDLMRAFPAENARRVVSARIVPDDGRIRVRFVLACDCDYAASVERGVLFLEFRDAPAGGADQPGAG